ncbi:MAG: alpha/beta fold hydrolase [Promethearchaeota archaeon]
MPFYRNSNNINLYYNVFNGHRKDTPIVMLHGFGSSAGFFREQLKILKSRNKVLVFDAEGHGKSEKNPEEKLSAHLITNTVEDLQEILYLLNINGPIGIIGHSLVGGGIGQKFALLYPERIKFLVLLNSGTMYIDNPIRNVFWNLLPQMVRINFSEIIVDNLEILLDKTSPYIRRAILGNKNYNNFYYEKLDGVIENEIFEMIRERLDPSGIKCPTLVIGAELDNYAPIWMSKNLAHKIANSRFEIIPMAGHFGPSHRADAYNKFIIQFLDDLGF